MLRLGLKCCLYNGFYSLIGRALDCESKDIGSIPIKNPKILLMLNFDPLEQFSIELYSSFFNVLLIKSISSLGLMSIFVFFLVTFCYYSSNSIFLLNKFQKSIISLFHFVLGILKDSLTIKKYSFILLFNSTFLFIFLSNILGMIPDSMTITSRNFVN
jgi:F0F1-type ATP synthase membrane subunit a